MDINYYDLENLEGDLELSDMRIDNLRGIEYCRNIRTLDLSNNNIIDITPIFELPNLEYINLIGNNIPEVQINYLERPEIMVIK